MTTHEQKASADTTKPRSGAFFLTSLAALVITFSILSAFDLVPEPLSDRGGATIAEADEPSEPVGPDPNPVVENYAAPVRIVAESVGLDVVVKNPLSSSLDSLNKALLEGAVRYPGSGILSDNENMLIFGHSSFLPVVRNKAFQAFNGLRDLKEGDSIRVYSDKIEYLYSVESVSHVNATETAIPLKSGEKRLTLSTCDTFGKKTDRYVVDASFIGSYPRS